MNLQKFVGLFLAFGLLLGIHDGKIALWQGEDPEPLRIFPYYAAFLPKKDRQALENGIRIDTSEDLIRLLEDFGS